MKNVPTIISLTAHNNATSQFNELKQKLKNSGVVKLSLPETIPTAIKIGEPHNPTFRYLYTLEIKYNGVIGNITATGEGKNKKESERACYLKINKEIIDFITANNTEETTITITGFNDILNSSLPVSTENTPNKKSQQVEKGSKEVQEKTEQKIFYATKKDNGLLGKGGFGSVYIAVKTNEKDKLVAVKVPKNSQERFNDEIEIHQKANQQGCRFILNVIEQLHVKDRTLVVLEYCKYGSLKQVVERLREKKEKISPTLTMRIFNETADALQYLHAKDGSSRRITHNDLKPDNILLSRDFHARLSDFGGATLATQTESRPEGEERKAISQYTRFFTPRDRCENPAGLPKKSHDVFGLGAAVFATVVRVDRRFPQFWQLCEDPFEVDAHLFEEIVSLKDGDGGGAREAKSMNCLRKIIKKCSVLKGSDGESDRPKIEDVRVYFEKLIGGVEGFSKTISKEVSRLEEVLNVEAFAYDDTWVKIDEVV